MEPKFWAVTFSVHLNISLYGTDNDFWRKLMSKLYNLHIDENRAVFLNWQFHEKCQYSKLLFSHGSCQHEQEFASHEGICDDNCNFSLISILGKNLRENFKKFFFNFFEICINNLIIIVQSYCNLNYEMFWCTELVATQLHGFTSIL